VSPILLPSSLTLNGKLWLEQWAKLHDVLLEAYSPLGSSKQVKETLELPIVGGGKRGATILGSYNLFLADQEGCG
jgi:diketogulonate reductase-like aldo/keto reductase